MHELLKNLTPDEQAARLATLKENAEKKEAAISRMSVLIDQAEQRGVNVDALKKAITGIGPGMSPEYVASTLAEKTTDSQLKDALTAEYNAMLAALEFPEITRE